MIPAAAAPATGNTHHLARAKRLGQNCPGLRKRLWSNMPKGFHMFLKGVESCRMQKKTPASLT